MPARPASIAAHLTVRQVALAWPACAALLEQYPAAKWEGRWSLQELGPFARRGGVDEAALLRSLAAAAKVPVGTQKPAVLEIAPLVTIFAAIAIGLTLGAGWGVGLLLRIAFNLDYGVVPGASVHVHGLAQLWGWMALFVFAVASHLLRQNTKSAAPAWLDRAAAGAVVLAMLIFFAGLVPSVSNAVSVVGIIASALVMLATICFAISAAWSIVGRGQRPLVWHYFVFAMLAWLGTWAGSDLALRWRHAGSGTLPDSARALLIVLPVLGFATNAIYGFGIRLIPGLLNIGRLRPRCFIAALALHNGGLVLLLTSWRVAPLIGSAMMLIASCVYLVGMDGLRSKPSRPIFGVDPRGHMLIRVAFFWLVCGLAMILLQQTLGALPHPYGGAWRHALTVGFITTMIVGVGQRIVPVFIKQPLASTRMMLFGAALLVVGNAGRVGLELATIGQWPWAFRLMGMTGLLELTALGLFALNLALTVRHRLHVFAPGDAITAATRVRELINVRPELQQRLREIGVTMFDEAGFIASSLTVGALALAWGRQPSDLLIDLQSDVQEQSCRNETLRPALI